MWRCSCNGAPGSSLHVRYARFRTAVNGMPSSLSINVSKSPAKTSSSKPPCNALLYRCRKHAEMEKMRKMFNLKCYRRARIQAAGGCAMATAV